MAHSMVLILGNEFDSNVTIIADTIRRLGGDILILRPGLDDDECMTTYCDNKNTSTCMQRTRGNFIRRFHLNEVTAVWSRGFDNNLAAWPGTTENFVLYEWRYYWKYLENALSRSRWINSISSIDKATDRIYQLDKARECGLTVPETLVTTRRSAAQNFLDQHECIAIKHLSSGAASESSDRLLLARAMDKLPSDMPAYLACPTLLQECIDKRVELRINVIGSHAYTGALTVPSSPTNTDIIDAKNHMLMGDFSYARYSLKKEVEQRVIALVHSMGLLFAAVDLAIDKQGRAVFFELNPSGQWYGFQTETGYPIAERIAHELLAD